MALDIVDYMTLPTEEEWRKFHETVDEDFKNILLDFEKDTHSILDVRNGKLEIEQWISEFNWRIFNIQINYMQVVHYLNKGVRDEEYSQLTGGNLANHIWFAYQVESLLTRIIGAFDVLFHLANAIYQLKIKEGMKFNTYVTQRLRNKNRKLHNLMKQIKKDTRFQQANKLRNDFVHNFTPTNLRLEVKEITQNRFSLGKGTYVKVSEIELITKTLLKYLEEIVVKFQNTVQAQLQK